MKKQTTPFIPYDYEAVFDQYIDQEDDLFVQGLRRKGKRVIYATKRIDAGDQVELEIYPEFVKREDIPAAGRRPGYNAQAQRTLKDKTARKNCERLINTNFTSQDIWATLSYTDRNLPQSMDEALKNMQRYIKRINYQRKKHGHDPAKYVYVTEWSEDDGGKIRCHHHIVMDGALSMDEVESSWKLGRRNQTRRLDYDENGLSGLAHYITKDPKGKKRWCASKNLKKPEERKNHKTFGPKKVDKMVSNYEDAVELIKAAAPGCWFKSLERRYNKFNGMTYIYAKLRRACAPGDLVHIRDAADLGYDDKAIYELVKYAPGDQAVIRKSGSKGRTYTVPLVRLHLIKKGGKKCKAQTKQRNSRR